MDIFDQATEIEERHRELAIQATRERSKQAEKFTGHCLNCNEQITVGRFCDSDCRDDWELLQNARIRGNRSNY